MWGTAHICLSLSLSHTHTHRLIDWSGMFFLFLLKSQFCSKIRADENQGQIYWIYFFLLWCTLIHITLTHLFIETHNIVLRWRVTASLHRGASRRCCTHKQSPTSARAAHTEKLYELRPTPALKSAITFWRCSNVTVSLKQKEWLVAKGVITQWGRGSGRREMSVISTQK